MQAQYSTLICGSKPGNYSKELRVSALSGDPAQEWGLRPKRYPLCLQGSQQNLCLLTSHYLRLGDLPDFHQLISHSSFHWLPRTYMPLIHPITHPSTHHPPTHLFTYVAWTGANEPSVITAAAPCTSPVRVSQNTW